MHSHTGVSFEHAIYRGPWGDAYTALAVAAAMAGWIGVRFRVDWSLLLAAAGSLTLLGLRPQVWDYYFMDVALFAFFSPVIIQRESGVSARRSAWSSRTWWALGLVVAIFHGRAAVQLKEYFDRSYALNVLAEHALRRGQIAPRDLSFAPFGMIGWHLDPYFVANDGKDDPNIAGFRAYLRPKAVDVRKGPRFSGDEPLLSRSITHPDDPNVIQSAVFPLGWFWRQRVALLRNPHADRDAARLRLDDSRYQRIRFPLNDEEWRGALGRVQE